MGPGDSLTGIIPQWGSDHQACSVEEHINSASFALLIWVNFEWFKKGIGHKQDYLNTRQRAIQNPDEKSGFQMVYTKIFGLVLSF